MPEVNLLPRKVFEIHGLDGYPTVSGQFGTWALARYGERSGGLSLADVITKLNDMTLMDAVKMILCAVEYKYNREKVSFTFNELDVSDWVDQLGGIGGAEVSKLFNHMGDKQASGDVEKKTEASGNGATLNELQPQQG